MKPAGRENSLPCPPCPSFNPKKRQVWEVPRGKSEKAIAITFWAEKKDAERYGREAFPIDYFRTLGAVQTQPLSG